MSLKGVEGNKGLTITCSDSEPSPPPPPRGFEEQGKLGNRGTKTKYLREQGNINHFRDEKAENKLGSNFGIKGTRA